LSGDRQACLGEWGEIDTTQSCPAARRIWEVNPAYFDKARPGAIQLIVLRTPQGPYHGESAERFKARQANALTRTPTGGFQRRRFLHCGVDQVDSTTSRSKRSPL
jgi:hypothetical protein